MLKISKKVKTKKVQSKKKTTKKKTAKKKTVKKSSKRKKTKKVAKKKLKRKRKKKMTMDDVYKILNKVQINRKKITFAMFIEEAAVAENIIRDTELKYNKIVMKTQTVFTVYPRKDDELDILEIDYLEDEIPEEGQIFG